MSKQPTPKDGPAIHSGAEISQYNDGQLVEISVSDTRLWTIRQGLVQKEVDVTIPGETRVIKLGAFAKDSFFQPASEVATHESHGVRVRYRAVGHTVIIKYTVTGLPSKREALLSILGIVVRIAAQQVADAEYRGTYEYRRAEEIEAQRAAQQRAQARFVESLQEEIAELSLRIIEAENKTAEAERVLTQFKVFPWDKIAPRVKPLLQEIERQREQMTSDALAYEQAHPAAAKALFDRGTLTEWEIADALGRSMLDPQPASPLVLDETEFNRWAEEPSSSQRGTLPYKPSSEDPKPPPISVPPASSVQSFEELIQTRTWGAVQPPSAPQLPTEPEQEAESDDASVVSFRDSLLEEALEDFKIKK